MGIRFGTRKHYPVAIRRKEKVVRRLNAYWTAYKKRRSTAALQNLRSSDAPAVQEAVEGGNAVRLLF